MKIYDHIGVWEGLVTKEFCQRVIDSFEHFYALKYVKKDISESSTYFFSLEYLTLGKKELFIENHQHEKIKFTI